MLTELKILEIAHQTQKEFHLNCEIRFLSYNKFRQIALKSPLISEIIKEGFTFKELEIPALVYHEQREHIYLCKRILNYLMNRYDKKTQKEFIKAVLYHELFHILDKNKMRIKNFNECLKSEERICKKFRTNFPHLFNESREIHKLATKF